MMRGPVRRTIERRGRGCVPRRWFSGIARLSCTMFVTSLATSKCRSRPAYVAAMEIDKPMNSIDSSTTTQPTKNTVVQAELTELLGEPHALTAPDAAAPDYREARAGAPMLTAITGGAL